MIVRACAVGALFAFGLAQPAAATTLYSQPVGQACSPSCWTSTSGSGNAGFQAFDNFRLATSANVKIANWQGFYFDFINRANNPVAPAPMQWTLGFYADNAGLPGVLLYTATEAAASVTTASLGLSSAFGSPITLYSFSAALPGSFAASAGTKYWFSPLSVQSTFNPFFTWSPAETDGDGVSAQSTPPGGSPITRPNDRAFSLEGGPASAAEPGTFAVLGLGFATLGGAALRRAKMERTAAAWSSGVSS